MNQFFAELLSPIVYKWISGWECVDVCDDHQTLCIENDKYEGMIVFYQDNITELKIIERETKDEVFYLHFQMHDFHSVQEQLDTFLDFMVNDENSMSENFSLQHKKILLSCSGGLTTSYFAYQMKELFKNQDIHIDAIGYTEIDLVANDYDVILIAPQINYVLPYLKQKYGNKIMAINPRDFATYNFNNILKTASFV